MLAGGEDASDEEDEEGVAPAVGSQKQKEMEADPEARAEVAVSDPAWMAASAEDLAKD